MSLILSQSDVVLLITAPFLGSFLGLLVERLPAGESVVLGRSQCRSCNTTLGPRDLVPLLSWAVGRGRCRHCGVPLGWFHPGIELAAIAVALWSVAAAPGWLAWASAGLGWTLLALAVIDRRHMILPDVLTLPLIPAGLAVAAFTPGGGIAHHLIGVAAGAACLGAVAWAYWRFRGREGLGLGDVKLFAAAGRAPKEALNAATPGVGETPRSTWRTPAAALASNQAQVSKGPTESRRAASVEQRNQPIS